MTTTPDWAAWLRDRLPPGIRDALERAASLASARGVALYLVGGAVRDLWLGRPSPDVDLTAAGDATGLTTALADELGGQLALHPEFGTATIRWDGQSLDVVTARFEHYPRPGALPVVRPGTLSDDLRRRDFTINALALRLDHPRWGELTDLTGGLDDLHHRSIRVLHERSFQDDPTRMFRAVRYEQRLGFRIEAETASWLRRDLHAVDTVTADRLRREIELILDEAQPEEALLRAHELGLLAAVHPALEITEATAAAFLQARERAAPDRPSAMLLTCLLLYDAPPADREAVAARLLLSSEMRAGLSGLGRVQAALPDLCGPEAGPSAVVARLETPLPPRDDALLAVELRTDVALARERIARYRSEWRSVRTLLTGHDLSQAGVPRGPLMGSILARLRAERLDGLIVTRDDEERLVRAAVAGRG